MTAHLPWTASLPADLPAGRLVGTPERYWFSAAPDAAGRWSAWRDRHAVTGLWPLLLKDVKAGEPPVDGAGESLARLSSPDDHDGPAVLAGWWRFIMDDLSEDGETVVDDLDFLRPYGPEWPGVSPALRDDGGAVPGAARVAAVADELLPELREPGDHLALVPAFDGAAAPAAMGWTGPCNHENDTGLIGAVLRDWQRRFGACVVGLGFDTLYLAVAAPPRTAEEALRVAAEHYAFCPDNIEQSDTDTIEAYAETLRGLRTWAFWWD